LAVSSLRDITVLDSGNMQPVWPPTDVLVLARRPADAVYSDLAFWQYQIHQESSYQQSVLKHANEKNAQSQKQLDNVIRGGVRLQFIVVSPHAIIQ